MKVWWKTHTRMRERKAVLGGGDCRLNGAQQRCTFLTDTRAVARDNHEQTITVEASSTQTTFRHLHMGVVIWSSWCGNIPTWWTHLRTFIHFTTNRDQARVTLFMWQTSLPLCLVALQAIQHDEIMFKMLKKADRVVYLHSLQNRFYSRAEWAFDSGEIVRGSANTPPQ